MTNVPKDYTGDTFQTSDNLLRWASEPVELESVVDATADPFWVDILYVAVGAVIATAGVLIGANL